MLRFPEWKYLKYNIQQKFASMTASKGYSPKSYKGDTLFQRLAAFRTMVLTNPILRACVSLLCLIAIVSIVRLAIFTGTKEKIIDTDVAWFYDMKTGELFTAGRKEIPPIATPSGLLDDGSDAGVMANVLTYDPTGKDPEKQFIGYLEKLTTPGKVVWAEAFETGTEAQMQWQTGRLIKRVDDDEWVQADSPKGLYIRNAIYQPNNQGEIPQYVLPE